MTFHDQLHVALTPVFTRLRGRNEHIGQFSLHLRVQVDFGRERHVQLIVESHSEHFLNRLQRRVAEGVLSPDDVAVYFCRRTPGETELEPLRLNLFGDIENWPPNFFGDEMADIAARTLAAMSRKKAQAADAPSP